MFQDFTRQAMSMALALSLLMVLLLLIDTMWHLLARKLDLSRSFLLPGRLRHRVSPAILGFLLIWSGLKLQVYTEFGFGFLAGFFLVTGAQIVLWSLGIALELFGNRLPE